MLSSPALEPMTRMPPTSAVISGADSFSMNALSTSRCSAGSPLLLLQVVAEAVGRGSRYWKESTSVISWVASVRPGMNGTVTS